MTFGFGLEKLGLIALRFPRATLLLVTAITVPLGYSAAKIEFSSDVREIFRSGSPDFVNLETVEKQYPESGEDILLLVEGENLFTPENLERLRNLHLELSLADGVRHVLSMFSARHPPDATGYVAAVFPPDLNEVEQLSELREDVLRHPHVSGKLLSEDVRTSLIIVAIDSQPDIENLRRIASDLQKTTNDVLAGSDLKAQFTGVAFLRIEIVAALIRDQRTFSIAGFVIAWVICWLFFRSVVYAFIAGVPAVIAVIWLIGTTQLRGQEVNLLIGVVPALVIVLVVASALHLLFGIRRNLAAGKPLRDSIERSVVEVGPACVLASTTTAIALLSLTLVSHSLIVGLGHRREARRAL